MKIWAQYRSRCQPTIKLVWYCVLSVTKCPRVRKLYFLIKKIFVFYYIRTFWTSSNYLNSYSLTIKNIQDILCFDKTINYCDFNSWFHTYYIIHIYLFLCSTWCMYDSVYVCVYLQIRMEQERVRYCLSVYVCVWGWVLERERQRER